MHVRVDWYASDTWCTCGSLVVLVGHVMRVQSKDALVVTCCPFGSHGELTVKDCTCGSLGKPLVMCETLHELLVTWYTRGSLGMLVYPVVNVWVTCMLGGHVVHVRVA